MEGYKAKPPIGSDYLLPQALTPNFGVGASLHKNRCGGLTGPFCFVKLILGMEKNVITFDKGSG